MIEFFPISDMRIEGVERIGSEMAVGEFETLQEKLKRVMENHIQHDHGLITAPDKLLDKLLISVGEWLQHDEENWGDCEGVVAEALRDLRTNQMR